MIIGLLIGVGGVLCIWLVFLTIYVLRLSAHYNNLVQSTNKRSLQAILEGVLKDNDSVKKDIDFLKQTCDTIIKDGKFHIQKIGLKRFNPFKDTGGDQSFILTIVDGNDTGVVISGLYSRSGTRWYAKQVTQGKGIEHELSEEEKSALSDAKQLKIS